MLSVFRPNWFSLVLLGVMLVMIDWLFLEFCLNYDFMGNGDVHDYWNDSLDWREPYDAFHMPGYAFTIALLRGATGSLLNPTFIMLAITLTAFSMATASVFNLAGHGQASSGKTISVLAATLFVLWPMVGTTYVAYPIADMFGMAPLLIGIWLLLKKQSIPGGLVLGLTLISHKAMWPFAILIILAHLITMRTKRSLAGAAVMLVPISVIWVLGAQHHDSAFWLISSNVDFEFKVGDFRRYGLRTDFEIIASRGQHGFIMHPDHMSDKLIGNLWKVLFPCEHITSGNINFIF